MFNYDEPGSVISNLSLIVFLIAFPLELAIFTAPANETENEKDKKATVQEATYIDMYFIVNSDNEIHIHQANDVYEFFKDDDYYYCYVDETSYMLLPIKETKIVDSLEAAKVAAEYYTSKGYNVKWSLLEKKKQANI